LGQEQRLHGRVRMQLPLYLSDHELLQHRAVHTLLYRHKQEVTHIR
jgi:hypothetical protein